MVLIHIYSEKYGKHMLEVSLGGKNLGMSVETDLKFVKYICAFAIVVNIDCFWLLWQRYGIMFHSATWHCDTTIKINSTS